MSIIIYYKLNKKFHPKLNKNLLNSNYYYCFNLKKKVEPYMRNSKRKVFCMQYHEWSNKSY